MFAFKNDEEILQEIEIIEPFYSIQIEETSEFIDYAASKNGGKIIKELSTEEYHGIGAFFTSNALDALLSDDNSPQKCWPIQGNHGYAAINLSHEIYPTGFSVVLPKKFFDTIPKNVAVYSLDSDKCYMLTNFTITINPQDLEIKSQAYFPCQYFCWRPTQLILVEINENYGNKHTCMYQFKAHGLISKK